MLIELNRFQRHLIKNDIRCYTMPVDQGRSEVLAPLLAATEWPAVRLADASAAAIEQARRPPFFV